MAATVTTYGQENAHIGRTPVWVMFDVQGVLEEGSTPASEEVTLMSIPIGTVMIDANVCCIVEGAGTGTDVLSIASDDGSTQTLVFTGTADNGGAVDVMDRALVVDGSHFPTTVARTLVAIRSINDDVTTPAEYRVAMLLCRPEYDR